jgi:hypothetical protein
LIGGFSVKWGDKKERLWKHTKTVRTAPAYLSSARCGKTPGAASSLSASEREGLLHSLELFRLSSDSPRGLVTPLQQKGYILAPFKAWSVVPFVPLSLSFLLLHNFDDLYVQTAYLLRQHRHNGFG